MTTTSGHPVGMAVRAAPVPARLGPGDLAGLAAVGLRTRKLRAGLSALGIAIGVAAIVAVLGLAASSSAALLAEIQQLGTNLLTVTNGQTFTGQNAKLPAAAPGLALSVLGLFHPAQLTPATAASWWQLHVVLLPVFPLLGAALVLLVRGERGPLAWLARLGAYVYAVFYTGLDTLADENRFFSYRRTTLRKEPDYGRQISAILLTG